MAALVGTVVAGSAAAAAAASAQPTQRAGVGFDWTQVEFAQRNLPYLTGSSMAYNAATKQLLLFGGYNGTLGDVNGTWRWTGTKWQPLAPVHSPTARQGAVMVFDDATNQLILFGGYVSNGGALSDTWSWDGTDWSELSPAKHPADLGDAAAAYDPASGIVLFGGVNSLGAESAETWIWNGTTWNRRTPSVVPPASQDAEMAYDTSSAQLLLFGGESATLGGLNDTWQWVGDNWQPVTTAHAPNPRQGAALTFDPVLGGIVLFGGTHESSYYADTWTWMGSDWTQVVPQHSPVARVDAASAFDPKSGNTVVFGGAEGSVILSDTWTGPIVDDSTPPTVTNVTSPQLVDDDFIVTFSEPVAVPCCDAITVTVSDGAPLATNVVCFSDPLPDGRCDEWTVKHAASLVAGQYYDVNFDSGSAVITDAVGNPLAPAVTHLRAPTTLRADATPIVQTWGSVSNADALGGSYVIDRSEAATYRYVFSGTSVKWLTITGPDQGNAFVKITNQGGHKVDTEVDNYAPTTTLDAPLSFTGLVNAKHTMTIIVEGASEGSVGNVAVDGFVLDGAVTVPSPKAKMTFAQVYTGGGLYYRKTATAGASFAAPFRGNPVTWVALIGPDGGKAKVTIDGQSQGVIDLYAATAAYKTFSFPTTDAVHTIKITALGTKNAASTDTVVGLEQLQIS
jgi:Galactose oxidase, central domain